MLGFFWTLLNPLLLTLVLWMVFSRLARMDEKSYPLFLLSGMMTWTFFSQSIERSLNSIIGNKGLIQKIYLPKLVFPVSIVNSNLVNFFFFLVAYLLIAAPTSVGIPATVWLLPLAIAMLYLLSAGGAMLICTLNVFFRDFTHLTSVLLRALFYLTPIFYKPDLLGPKTEALLRLNPVFYPVVVTRDLLYYGQVPSLEMWLTGFGFAVALFTMGLMTFTSTQNKFVYYG